MRLVRVEWVEFGNHSGVGRGDEEKWPNQLDWDIVAKKLPHSKKINYIFR
jgi:hypothetical protein